MTFQTTHWQSQTSFLSAQKPDKPVTFYSPEKLTKVSTDFQNNFQGEVSYAVKSNPDPIVIRQLILSGINSFDVASPVEIDLVRDLGAGVKLQYNNPVRSRSEIAYAVSKGVRSFSVDRRDELNKLLVALPAGCEISVRLKLDQAGGAYDFGEKFGATEQECIELLRIVTAAGHRGSMTFHPGTQCTDPAIWGTYISTCADIALRAETKLFRLNVGGGFPADRGQENTDLKSVFNNIHTAWRQNFGAKRPLLLCEPGRAMVADAFDLCCRIKSLAPGEVFLNDGIYGGLSEFRDVGHCDRYTVFSPTGERRIGKSQPFVAFGPTCDSLDKLPKPLNLPSDTQEDDYILIKGMGAYVRAISTSFNGYGDIQTVLISQNRAV